MISPNHESPAIRALLNKLFILGAIGLGVSAWIAPERLWVNLLVGLFFLVTLGLGAVMFIAVANICGASWNIAFRRVPEAMAGTLPFTCLILLVVLISQAQGYGWNHEGHGGAGTFWFKEMWTQPQFWGARAIGYVVLWILLSRALIANSRRQDNSGELRLTLRNKQVSALFLAVYAATFTLASIDWIMLLEPMWFSTIWGVYHFAGMFQATLAVVIIFSLALRKKRGPLEGAFSDEHLHDLGKLLVGMSCFWMYIWFSQYMLIWYSNIPEETAYYIPRVGGAWGPIMVISLVLNWIIPFFVLLPRESKRSGSVMMKIAVVVLIGRWFDLYTMVMPAIDRETPFVANPPQFGLTELATICCLIGLFGSLFYRSFYAAAAVPKKDPLLAESLHYHC